MARPKQPGLKYYPHDTTVFSDREIRRLIKNCGHAGFVVYDYLLCLIYGGKGYFITVEEGLFFDISDFLNSGISEGDVENIVNTALKIGLFHVDCYKQHNVLTSPRIQATYLEAKKGGVIDTKLWVLTSKTTINSELTPTNHEIIPESKEEESKSNEKKTNELEFFRLAGSLIKGKPGIYFETNFPTFVEQWIMKHDKQKTFLRATFDKMDIDYACYTFSNTNHLQNSFKLTFEKIKNGTGKNKISDKEQRGGKFGAL